LPPLAESLACFHAETLGQRGALTALVPSPGRRRGRRRQNVLAAPPIHGPRLTSSIDIGQLRQTVHGDLDDAGVDPTIRRRYWNGLSGAASEAELPEVSRVSTQ
jgi:hypothetical protein